jgi:hypothetical protein
LDQDGGVSVGRRRHVLFTVMENIDVVRET